MTQWQTMETAPRNQGDLLLFTKWRMTPDYPVPDFDAIQIGTWLEGQWQTEKIGTPTHWMPLPSPPGAGA